MIPHIHTLFEFISIPYENQHQTLNIKKIDRGQIKFREYSITLLQPLHFRKERESSGGVVVKLLACGARGPGFDSWSRNLKFREWLSPASKWWYGWNTAKPCKSSIQPTIPERCYRIRFDFKGSYVHYKFMDCLTLNFLAGMVRCHYRSIWRLWSVGRRRTCSPAPTWNKLSAHWHREKNRISLPMSYTLWVEILNFGKYREKNLFQN